MQGRLHYGCDFFSSQSIAQEEFREQLARSLPETQANGTLDNLNYERELQHAIDSFLRVDCVKSEDLKRFTKGILRMEVSRKLGLLLFEVCLLEFNLLPIAGSNKLEQLEGLRERIYDSLQELCVVYGKDKDKYLQITPLLYCGVLKKLFTVSKKLINADQKYRLFHVVFFELKGQLVSDQFLEGQIEKHFNDNYGKFIRQYSQNMTPVKPKDKSLTKSEVKALEPRFTKVNRENKENKQSNQQSQVGSAYYQTNRHLLGRIGKTETTSPRNLEVRRRL